MNARAVCRISISGGGHADREPGRRATVARPAWHKGRGTRLEGSFRADEVATSLPAGPPRRRPQAQGRARPGRSARPDLTARAESSVDGAGPGRQASGTCPPARDPAAAQELGRSLPAATARDSRWPPGLPRPPGHPRPPRTITRPGAPGRGTGRCLPRQAGRPVTRQADRQTRPARVPAGPGEAGRAGQRRNIPAGVNRD